MNLQAFVEASAPDRDLFGARDSSPFGPSGGGRDLPGGGTQRDGAPKRILLVEDDRGIRETLRGILEDEGYAVALAEHGREALDSLRAHAAPDLIVLDLRMPVMDGWQFRAAQKNDPTLANIPVLAISADGSAMAEAIDAQAYLRKPLSTASLLNAITRILGDDERRRLLGKLEEAERFAALGRLAASVGHEINNPLAYVSMNVEMAIEEIGQLMADASATLPAAAAQAEAAAQASPAAQPVPAAANPDADGEPSGPLASLLDMFQQCRIGVDRIRDVVKDLQKLSRARQVRRDAFSLNSLVDETLAIARNAVEHRARLRKEYGQLPPVMGDRSAIGQVLLNLLLNAAEALPEGLAHANQVRVRTYADTGRVIFEIADTGPGIPPHVLPHIFDPFYTTKPIGEGTGLGLAVSLRIVTDHGGHIDVDSAVGRGTVFRVVLPVTAPVTPEGPDRARDARPPRGNAEAAPRTRARVLIIDDVPMVAKTIAASLVDEHEVTPVASVTEAFVHLASGRTFDVILCDLLMPEIGGRQFFERLIAEHPQLAPRVVFMTGGAFTPESLEFIERSPQRVLIKPFAIEELKQLVREQMQADDRLKNRGDDGGDVGTGTGN